MKSVSTIPQGDLEAWLTELPQGTEAVSSPAYRLRIWKEQPNNFSPVLSEMQKYIELAHEDARLTLRKGFEDNLSPFSSDVLDPAANYPSMLNKITLQGYFGETLGVLAVEHWGAHGSNEWQIPAFLFRFHDTEFQHLDTINTRIADGEEYDPDVISERRPGRTGDDGIAFIRDAENNITHILTLECKCVGSHSANTIKDAHEKLHNAPIRPQSVHELIRLLQDYKTDEAKTWVEALLKIWHGGFRI
jgi:hypothetical protein